MKGNLSILQSKRPNTEPFGIPEIFNLLGVYHEQTKSGKDRQVEIKCKNISDRKLKICSDIHDTYW